MQKKIILKCPNCKTEFEAEGPYDENTDELNTCPGCDWITSKWTFKYVSEVIDNDGK
jgi:hypothetical protein